MTIFAPLPRPVSLAHEREDRRRRIVLEFVQALHEAFHTESRWLFVLYMGLGSALVFGLLAAALAYVVDAGYQRSLKENAVSAPASATEPTVVRDTAEEDRLKAEVRRLEGVLDAQKQEQAAKEKHEAIRTKLGEALSVGKS